ncbi:hypothetical protein HYC85_003179 [Camellia sinensis]|uniref:Uncharacterized protein n=1 Tax=Camellia sinensis TaxID=4442 RepID=A0A7J7IAK2_CAMSI|nr:hypothetical protein HYC85_003179 [Camellia sinensis]
MQINMLIVGTIVNKYLEKDTGGRRPPLVTDRPHQWLTTMSHGRKRMVVADRSPQVPGSKRQAFGSKQGTKWTSFKNSKTGHSTEDFGHLKRTYAILGTDDTDSYVTYESLDKNYNDLEEDIWAAFCQRLELMYDNELDQLVSGFRELISELVSVRKSGTFHQSLLMASYVEAGSLITCILNEGVHSLKVEVVKDLLALFRKSYSNPHPPLTHFGGILGVSNALGAGAGTLVPNYLLKTLHTTYDQKDSFYIMGPLLSCPILESQLTSLVQEMFLVHKNSDDHQLQQYAAWTVSFIRHYCGSENCKTLTVVSQNRKAYYRFCAGMVRISVWKLLLTLENAIPGIEQVHSVEWSVAVRCLAKARQGWLFTLLQGLVAESVASYLWVSIERIYDWAMRIARSDDSPILQPIDKRENVSVMHRTCVSLKDYLPPEK